MKLSRVKLMGIFFLAVILAVPAWAARTDAYSALPGTLNYVEGQVAIGDETLNTKSIGSAQLQPGQTLTTANGKAEMLLTPGVFLRLDSNSSVKMISPGLIDTRVALPQGRAMIEVAEFHPQNNLQVTADGATARLLKTGLYDFDAAGDQFRVFDGKAVVQQGDQQITVKGGHEVDLSPDVKLKAKGFDKKALAGDDLYRWSSLRSSYLAEANVDAARVYVANGWYGPGWFGGGWYWDPWFGGYTFIPGSGILYSPFGWGFYSPLLVYRSPFFYSGHYYRTFGPGYRSPYVGIRPGFRGPAGGFHGGGGAPRGFGEPGGGFHGGVGRR